MAASPGGAQPANPLIEARFFIPQPRAGSVPRRRLAQKLSAGTGTRLTLLSAPAGFGKSSLLAQWLEGEPDVAWLALTPAESEPSQFWRYFLAAVARIRPSATEAAASQLEATPAPDCIAISRTFVNALAVESRPFTLVLDDYHEVDGLEIGEGIAFLVDNLPPVMRLVIATRSDPPVALSRLRARGDICEIRVDDLRFTREEVGAFLSATMRLEVNDNGVASLESRTEGWPAGLQLAGLSLQGRDDLGAVIDSFGGDDRYIFDYLLDEVLAHQPPDVRQFLLYTSVLGRLNAGLCEAVSGCSGGQATLERLERDNLFVIPLDQKREWYRYHHLFAEVLQAAIGTAEPGRLSELHGRASAWYAAHGHSGEAIHHALAAGDIANAADLIETSWRAMDTSRHPATWLSWARQLPATELAARPVLNAGMAWALLSVGDLEQASMYLDAADAAAAEPAPVVADHAEFNVLTGVVASARAYLAQANGDARTTILHARRALDVLPVIDRLRRGSPSALLGIAAWAVGDLEAAEAALADGVAARSDDSRYALPASYVLGLIQVGRGELDQAQRTYQRAIAVHGEATGQQLPGLADLHVGLADVLYERNELDAAEVALATSKELGNPAAGPHWSYRWLTLAARLAAARGDTDGAFAMFDRAEEQYVRGPVPSVRPIGALRARLQLRHGNIQDAVAWVDRQTAGLDLLQPIEREFVDIVMAEIAVRRPGSRSGVPAITEKLEAIVSAASASSRIANLIEAGIVLAQAYDVAGDSARARQAVEDALTTGGQAGFIMPLVDGVQPLRSIIATLDPASPAAAYAATVLAEFGPGPFAPAASGAGLPEPLTPREIEVLGLVAGGMRNHEIAERLVISLATVKRHIANAYGKLGARNRVEAIDAARSLDIL